MVNIHFRGKTYPGGYWGPRTSTLDWCEPNYKHSRYIAEMANTQTNLIMLAFALLGVYFRRKESLPIRYEVANWAFAMVAVGSYAFHGTLLYEMQLLDELPMIISSSCTIFNLLDSSFAKFNKPLVAFMVAANAIFAVTYSTVWRHPLYHQFVFAITMLFIPARAAYLLRSPAAAGMAGKQRKQIISLYVAGATLSILAFAVWNVDNIWCEVWDGLKYQVGWPTAFFLEGHAWWHIGVGAGTYYLNTAACFLTLLVKESPVKYELRFFLGLPYVGRVDKNGFKAE